MPATERSLGPERRVVETSVIGARVGKGRLSEHLVLPLGAINVHHRAVTTAVASYPAMRVRGVARTGVHAGGVLGRVYMQGVYSSS